MRRCVVGVSVLLVALLLACGGAAVKEEKKPRTREELKKAVMGKTKDEVKALLGKPHETQGGGGDESWTYRRVSYDPVAEKVDVLAWIYFDGKGRVKKVDF